MKNYINKHIVTTCSVVGVIGLVFPLTAFAEDTTKVIGTFESTVLDVSIPMVTTFIYNPNTEEVIAQNINIQNKTNAPIDARLQELNIAEQSEWKPNLVSPIKYSESEWRNLTKKLSSEEVALGLYAIDNGNWLSEVTNKSIWSIDSGESSHIGTIKTKETTEVKPVLRAGTSLPTEQLLTANYIFEFGLAEGVPKFDYGSSTVLPSTNELTEGESKSVSFELIDGKGNPMEDGKWIKITFPNSTIPPQTKQVKNGVVTFDIKPNEIGDLLYVLTDSEKQFSYTAEIPFKVVDSEDNKFDIDINDDVIVDEDDSISFKPGTWAYVGGRTQVFTPEKEFFIGGSGTMGYYTHPLTKTVATFDLDVKSVVNDGYHGFNSMMLIRTGNTGLSISFYPDKIEIYDDAYGGAVFTHALDGTVYHNYRLVKDDDKGTLYIDRKKITTFNLKNGSGYGQHVFMFGDITSMGGSKADAYYKNVRIAPGEALYLD